MTCKATLYDIGIACNQVVNCSGRAPLLILYIKACRVRICWKGNVIEQKHCTTNYRIDRMDDVRIEAEERTPKTEYQSFNPEKYRREVFSMFGGEACDVELTFTAEMISDIYDKFGEDTDIIIQVVISCGQ